MSVIAKEPMDLATIKGAPGPLSVDVRFAFQSVADYHLWGMVALYD